MSIAVIGSGGFIGRHLVAALRGRGEQVVTLSSTDGTGIDPQTGRLPADFQFPAGVKSLVFLAQSPRYRKGIEQLDHITAVNTQAAVDAACAARRSDIGRMIYASTGSVYGPSFDPLAEDAPLARSDAYVLSKVHAEEALSLLEDTIDITRARLFGVYGPTQRHALVPNLVDAIRRGDPVRLQPHPHDSTDEDGFRVSMCYVADAVSILAALIGIRGTATLNLAGPRPISIRELGQTLAGLLECELKIERVAQPRPGDRVADVSLLKRLLNPSFTSLEEGLASTVGELVGASRD